MYFPQAPHSTGGYSEASRSRLRLHSMDPELLQALTATQPLHPKQLDLLKFLNQRRDPQDIHRTAALSYARLHEGTGISIEHIRRNALPRLLRNGLISVLAQTFAGTIYNLRFHQQTLHDVLAYLQHTIDDTISQVPIPASTPEPYDLPRMLSELDTLRHLQQQRQTLLRDEFAARLTSDQSRWLILKATQIVDAQEGIRFIKDRFPHYEAARVALLDEWRLREQYGEHIPSPSVPEGAIP